MKTVRAFMITVGNAPVRAYRTIMGWLAILFLLALALMAVAGCNTVNVRAPAGSGPITVNVTQSRSVPVDVARGARASGLP